MAMNDHPKRRTSDLAVFGWIRSPVVQAVLDLALLALLFVAVAQQIQLRNTAAGLKDEIQARSQASYENCQSANDSRQALLNVLMAGQAAVRASDRTPAEKAATVAFYQNQIEKVKLADCSAYLPKQGD